jgi:hypothetical protein
MNNTIADTKLHIGHAGKFLIMGYNNKCLAKGVPKFEKQLMQFLFVQIVKIT